MLWGSGFPFTPSRNTMKFNNKDLDPKGDMKVKPCSERGERAFYKGKPMKYLDYMSESCERFDKQETQFRNTRKSNNLSFSK